MMWPFYRLSGLEPAARMVVHYGIPRTSSSTVRGVLRRAARVYGNRLHHLFFEDSEIEAGIELLLTESPLRASDLEGREALLVTSLRDPVETTTSFYYHRRLLARERPRYACDMTPAEYAAALPPSYNVAARYLASLQVDAPFPAVRAMPDFLNDEDGFFRDIPDDELFAMATESLASRFALVTRHDRIEPLLLFVADLMGWPGLPLYQIVNWSPRFAHEDDWKAGEISQTVRSCNTVDLQVLSYADERYRGAIAALETAQGARLSKYRALSERAASASLSENGLAYRGGRIVPAPDGAKALALDDDDFGDLCMIEDFDR